MTSDSPVLYSRYGKYTAVITLNRIKKKNAINLQMAKLIKHYIQQAENDDNVRVIILSGLPGVFSAGMDIQAFQQGELPIVIPEGFGGIIHSQLTKVIIAAVDGIAFGGGFEIALACDLIIASHNARFSFPETGLGLVAAQGGCARLPARISPYIALDWLLTGKVITPEEALQHGVISRISERLALEEAVNIAEIIGQKNALASRAVKDIVHHGLMQHETMVFDYQENWVDILRNAARKN